MLNVAVLRQEGSSRKTLIAVKPFIPDLYFTQNEPLDFVPVLINAEIKRGYGCRTINSSYKVLKCC